MKSFFYCLKQLNRGCEFISCVTGRTLSWLVVIMAITTTAIVVARHLFSAGSVGVQEAVIYMHAFLIMCVSAYTLEQNEHVRVDIFYRQFSPLAKAWVDLLGTLIFLLPFALVTMVISWGFVIDAWANTEGSADAGGIPAIYILKSLLMAHGALLTLQALAIIAKTLSFISLKPEQPS